MLIRKKVTKFKMKTSIVQRQAVKVYNKAAKLSPLKLYPSLELVRLEKIFFKGKKGNLLEIGFGSGCNTIHMLKCGYKVYGVDVANNARIRATKRISKIKGVKKPILKIMSPNSHTLPFKDNTFDYVVAMSVLSLLGTEKNIKNLLKEIRRVVKPGGKVIVDINDQKSEFAEGKRMIKKNTFLNHAYNQKFNTICLKNIKEFEKLIAPYFTIIDKGFSAFSLFGREIKEFIISCKNNKS